MINRRQFLKGLGIILALPIAGNVSSLLASQHIEYLFPNEGIQVTKIGKVEVPRGIIKYEDGRKSYVIRYHLYKPVNKRWGVQAIVDIDAGLIKIHPNPDEYIRESLDAYKEALMMTYEDGIREGKHLM